jgi:uncharacterized protein YbaP (TraB family)
MSRIFSIFLCAVIACVALTGPMAAVAAPQQATPAFWVVEKNGKILYLLGSVHLLPPDLTWTRDEIERARASSQVFAFEAPLKDAEIAMARFVDAHGRLPKGKTLKDRGTREGGLDGAISTKIAGAAAAVVGGGLP